MKENKLLHRFHKLHSLVKFFIALAAAAIVLFLVRDKSGPVQVMSAWVCFSLVMLAISWTIMLTAHPREIMAIAKNQDLSRTLLFLIILVASFVSLVTIVLMLRELPHPGEKGYYFSVFLSIASVACSWFLIHTIFTSHYAHLFYTCKTDEEIDKEHRGGLEFPDEKAPDYRDFAYFSFVIGMTFQVSDVVVTSGIIRRRVLLHGLISFLFNTIIIAVSINIIAGLIHK
jgi:uncharacterized membrane protein